MFDAIGNSLFSLIYPQECRVCGSQVEKHSDGVACSKCWQATRFFDLTEMLCDKCGAYLGEKAAPIPVFCRKCDDHYYDKALACGVYESALAAAIVSLKNTPSLTLRLKTTISTLNLDILNSTDLIVPIPLSARRRIERGFNQAEIIAGALSRSTGIPVDAHSLARKVHTPIHRVGMDQKARELSVKNAFKAARPKLIDGKNILLVDDVLTSGATASSCAKALKKSGAVKVNVFTLARAVRL
ncbi:MAG: double zinc ribbon domain-containing protein [Pyrinomonadaceae bacterium]